MNLLLFAFYLFLFSWLVTKIKFLSQSGLTKTQLISIYLIKVIAAIVYGWWGVHFSNLIPMDDTWWMHFDSLGLSKTLQTQPNAFFTLDNHYDFGYGNFLSSHSWWNDLHNNALMRVLAIFDLFSRGNYFINALFYSFITLFGPVALYHIMIDHLEGKKRAVFAGCFLIPSFVYWTSGIHKDGLAFLGMALIIYQFYWCLKKKQLSLKQFLIIALGFILLLVFRNYLLIVLVPALCGWYMATKIRRKPLLVITATYAFFVFVFFAVPCISPRLNLPRDVVEKQEDFLTLKGNSFVPVQKLQANFRSFVACAPHALALSLFRPYPSDAKHLFSLASAIEVAVLWFLVIISLFGRDRFFLNTPFIITLFFLSISILLIIGYTVNFMGAIVRYRSITLPFIIIPLLAGFSWKSIQIKH